MSTKYTPQDIDNLLGKLPQNIADDIIDEVIVNIDMAFALRLFEGPIEEVISSLKDQATSEKVIEHVQSIEFTDDEILQELKNRLGDEKAVDFFAEDVVSSVMFNIEGPKEFKDFVVKEKIEEESFFKALIGVLAPEFLEQFTNPENNLLEWKNDVIEVIVDLVMNQ